MINGIVWHDPEGIFYDGIEIRWCLLATSICFKITQQPSAATGHCSTPGDQNMDAKNILSKVVDKHVKPAIDQYKSSDWGSKWSQQPTSGFDNQPSTPDNKDSTGSSESAPWQGDWQSALSDVFKKGHGSGNTGTGNTGTDNTGTDNSGSDNTSDGSTSSGGDTASSGAPTHIHGHIYVIADTPRGHGCCAEALKAAQQFACSLSPMAVCLQQTLLQYTYIKKCGSCVY
jgi:hypothetical protein